MLTRQPSTSSRPDSRRLVYRHGLILQPRHELQHALQHVVTIDLAADRRDSRRRVTKLIAPGKQTQVARIGAFRQRRHVHPFQQIRMLREA